MAKIKNQKPRLTTNKKIPGVGRVRVQNEHVMKNSGKKKQLVPAQPNTLTSVLGTIADITDRLNRAKVNQVGDCITATSSHQISTGDFVTVVNGEFIPWDGKKYKAIYRVSSIISENITACQKALYGAIGITDQTLEVGDTLYATVGTSTLSDSGDAPVATITENKGSGNYEVWFDAQQFGEGLGQMRGFFNPTLSGGGLKDRVEDGTTRYSEDQYLIAVSSGTYDFVNGVPDPSATSVVIGERILYRNGTWAILGIPESHNRGWFDPTVHGGGANVPAWVKNGQDKYRNGDYLIANKEGHYLFTDGQSDVSGEIVKPGDRITYDGSVWVVITASLGLIQGWFDPTMNGGGNGVPHPVVNGTVSYKPNEYVVAVATGEYDFGTGSTGQTATSIKVKAGERIRLFGDTWVIMPGESDIALAVGHRVHQADHGFIKFESVYTDINGKWQKALANTEETLKEAVVSEVIDMDNFEVIYEGQIQAPGHIFTTGDSYYLSETVPGGASLTPPEDDHSYTQHIFEVQDTETIFVVDREGSPASGIPTFASNRRHHKNEMVWWDGMFWKAKYTVQNVVFNPDQWTQQITKWVKDSIDFGSRLGQHIKIWGKSYGMGMQVSTFYFRTGEGFAWFRGGEHDDAQNNPGTGGESLMYLSSAGLQWQKDQTLPGNAPRPKDFITKQYIDSFGGANEYRLLEFQWNATNSFSKYDGGEVIAQTQGDFAFEAGSSYRISATFYVLRSVTTWREIRMFVGTATNVVAQVGHPRVLTRAGAQDGRGYLVEMDGKFVPGSPGIQPVHAMMYNKEAGTSDFKLATGPVTISVEKISINRGY